MDIWQSIKDGFTFIYDSIVYALAWVGNFALSILRQETLATQKVEPFNISKYLQRREKLILSLEDERRAEYTIVLWWGYDGLRLNKDGSWEWISRKKSEPIENGAKGAFCTIPRGIFEEISAQAGYFIDLGADIDNTHLSMAQLYRPAIANANQCIQAQIDELRMQNAAQSVNVLAYQPGYLGCCAPIYSSLTGCCCNQTILR